MFILSIQIQPISDLGCVEQWQLISIKI